MRSASDQFVKRAEFNHMRNVWPNARAFGQMRKVWPDARAIEIRLMVHGKFHGKL